MHCINIIALYLGANYSPDTGGANYSPDTVSGGVAYSPAQPNYSPDTMRPSNHSVGGSGVLGSEKILVHLNCSYSNIVIAILDFSLLLLVKLSLLVYFASLFV